MRSMKSYITDKPLKTISLEGCESIGRGAHGEVFRIAPDTAVKVYYPDITMDRIERELNYAKKHLSRASLRLYHLI